AIHIAIEFTLPNGKKIPVEVQVMTRAAYEWGQIQHDLTYKNKNLPPVVKKVANDHCAEGAKCLAHVDQGVTDPEIPKKPDLSKVDGYLDLSPDTQADLDKAFDGMQSLMKKYKMAAELPGEEVKGEKSEETPVSEPLTDPKAATAGAEQTATQTPK